KNGSQVMTAKGFVSLYLGDLCPQHGDTCLGSLPAMRIWQAIGRFFGIVERRPCSRQGRWLLGKRGFGLFAMVMHQLWHWLVHQLAQALDGRNGLGPFVAGFVNADQGPGGL